MLGVSIAAFSFILFSSIFGMPISGTHTVVGAIIGAGLAAVGGSGINWHYFFVKVVLSWFISPVTAALLCGLLFILVCFSLIFLFFFFFLTFMLFLSRWFD